MTSKQRVQAAFDKQDSDHVPIYLGSISSRIASQVLGREAHVGGGIQQYRETLSLWNGGSAHDEFIERSRTDAVELGEKLDLDYVRPSYWRMNEKPTARIDDYTFMFGDPDGYFQVMRFDPESELYSIIDQKTRAQPELPDELEPVVEQMEKRLDDYHPAAEDFADISYALNYFGEKRAVNGSGIGYMMPAYEQVWLMAMVMRPDLLERYMKVRLNQVLRNIEVLGNIGSPYLHGGGDFAGNNGPYFSSADFEHFIMPGLQAISSACEKYGLYHMFASDGDLWPVAKVLFGRSGLHGYYEIDRRCGMDLRRLRREYPKLTLLGGISSATLHIGTPEDVIAEARDAIEAGREYGGIIAGCSNMVVPPTPYKNFAAMMDTLHKYK
ncbi:MAG: uroporphyrinogen decarboxylase family protein [Treponema sp.]|nr:uroporphyrinogen decarboxylase family protein [Treponema sp.]